jgi:hypothetical protein
LSFARVKLHKIKSLEAITSIIKSN